MVVAVAVMIGSEVWMYIMNWLVYCTEKMCEKMKCIATNKKGWVAAAAAAGESDVGAFQAIVLRKVCHNPISCAISNSPWLLRTHRQLH